MRLLDEFDAVRVINLPARTDRRRAVTADLTRCGMAPAPAPAKVAFFDAIRPADPGGFDAIGTRGCYSSHLEILRGARDAGCRRLLVLEDDLQLSRRFPALEGPVAERLRADDWGLAYLGHVVPLPPGGPPLVPFDGPLTQSHFIAVHGRIIGRLVAFLDELLTRPAGHPDGGPMHYDGALTTFRARNPDVLTLLANPVLGWQRSSRSDIYRGRWFDHTPVVSGLVGLARRGSSWLRSYR